MSRREGGGDVVTVSAVASRGRDVEEKWWGEQSSMSRLLEKLRRAAEVFADPKVENELSEDEKGVKSK